MPVRDSFPYNSRWDSVGLDCSYCLYFGGPRKWPDKLRQSHCKLHGISLAIEIAEDGFKLWEWFCKDFLPGDSRVNPDAVAELNRKRKELQAHVLYRLYGEDGYLLEFSFSSLDRAS